MKKIKEIILGLLIISAAGAFGMFVYNHETGKTNRELAKRMAEVSPGGALPETIEGLRQAIALYEEQIERNVREGVQTGIYWKILATRLADKSMHRDALDAYERAIYFNSEDPALYYLTGVSAAIVAKEVIGFGVNSDRERERFYNLSENAYLRSLDLDPLYTRPMYGVAVLYVFELDRPNDALPHLEHYLSIHPTDTSAMFVHARANFMLENYSAAIDMYDRIIARSRDQKVREEASINRDYIQGLIYER
jgi:tetratricopeptide (TPR) repeat protein